MARTAKIGGETLPIRLLVAAALALVVLCHALALANAATAQGDGANSSTDLLGHGRDRATDAASPGDLGDDCAAILAHVSPFETTLTRATIPSLHLTSSEWVRSLLRTAPKTSPPQNG